MTKIPLSRSYLHTAWPVAVFNVMSKPGGAACNMACEYCFYRHNAEESGKQNAESRNGEAEGEGALERFIAEYIASQDNPTVFFTWQGGEPTLVGLDFYRKVIALQQKHARKGVAIANSLQTNGILLDEPWCEFLAANRFTVGLSVDGPVEVHDRYRRMRNGEGTHAQVRRAAELLRRHEVRFDTLSTITPANVERAEEVYDFLTRGLGAAVVQFQPCVERKDFREVAPGCWPSETILPVGDARLRPGTEGSLLTEWSISAEQWGRFLCELFDLWWGRDRERVVVSWFAAWASQFAGGSALQCMTSPICGRAVSMEQDGRVFSCDHYVYPEYCLGKVGETGLSELVRCQRQKEFGEAKSKSLPGYCRRCPFLFACYGECPKRRFVRTPEGEAGLNYLCAGFRVFFDHAGARLAEYGRRQGKIG